MERDLYSCWRDGNKGYGAVEQLLSSLELGELSKSFVTFRGSWCLRHRRDIRICSDCREGWDFWGRLRILVEEIEEDGLQIGGGGIKHWFEWLWFCISRLSYSLLLLKIFFNHSSQQSEYLKPGKMYSRFEDELHGWASKLWVRILWVKIWYFIITEVELWCQLNGHWRIKFCFWFVGSSC